MKIVVTGGTGRFGSALKEFGKKNKYIFPKKKELDILNVKKTINYLKRNKPKYLIHLAGLSRPMKVHENDIQKSINLNIIGTSNIVNICSSLNIKIIYFSTNYVYPNKNGDYSEKDPVFPINNYAWSKLGGECAVQMYKNSLIIRACMTEYPFIHKSAFSNMYTNFIYHKDFIKILENILHKKGILNVGGKGMSVFDFVKKDNPNIKKIKLANYKKNSLPLKSLMSLKKLKMVLKNKI
mgnify:CR=1 FL=1